MNKLVISTRYPMAVSALLVEQQLVEHIRPIPSTLYEGMQLEVPYPDDAISQSLAFWFALAEGCGLVSDYQLVTPWMEREREEARKNIQGI